MLLNNLDWHKKDYKEFLKYLNSIKDIKYKNFHKKLILNNNLIGIRTPKLKEISKEISKGNYRSFINLNEHKTYEECIIHGLILGYIKLEFKQLIELLNQFLPYITNWAINDIVAANLKSFKKNQKEGFKYIKNLLKSKNSFEIRFGLVLLLDFYINDNYIDIILDIVKNIKSDEYYVKMANSWLISICYIKYPIKTKLILENKSLDKWTHNKTISKIKDSKRVDNKTKLKLEKLKR